MDNNTLAIYIHELRNQCIHTQASFNLFNQAMTNRAGSGVLYSAQMILMPASQVSALLWPTRARARGRGEALRKVLNLGEKHPLNNRQLSELWERADEKMEEWVVATKGKQVVFDFVGDPAQLGDGTTDTNCIFRAYNPATRVFFYRGVPFSLQAVADAMMDVSGRINAVYHQLFPEQAKAEDEARRKAQEAAQAAQAAQTAQATADAGVAANDEAPEIADAAPAKPAKKSRAKKAD